MYLAGEQNRQGTCPLVNLPEFSLQLVGWLAFMLIYICQLDADASIGLNNSCDRLLDKISLQTLKSTQFSRHTSVSQQIISNININTTSHHLFQPEGRYKMV